MNAVNAHTSSMKSLTKNHVFLIGSVEFYYSS